MTRSRSVQFGVVAVLTAAVVGMFWIARPVPPNVVLIVVDTLRADGLGCYGGRPKTPRIDALAASGHRHELALGSFHQTTASMGAMFLGATPSLEAHDGSVLPWNRWTRCGMSRFGTGDADSECLPKGLPTLAERMREAGYHTVGIVSNEMLFRPAGFDRGFDVWREVALEGGKPEGMSFGKYATLAGQGRSAPNVLRAATAALEGAPGEPLFLYVHFMDVHDWWTPGIPERHFKHSENYWKPIEQMDTRIGELLDSLGERGLMKDALVILTADHAETLGEPHPIPCMPTHQGNPTYETVSRIPLIVSRPGAANGVTGPAHALWRTQDLTHYLAGLAGIETNDLPSTPLGDDECYFSEAGFRTLRAGAWKLTCPRAGDASACALFDLAADPGETRNVASGRSDVLATLFARIEALASRLRSPAPAAEPVAPSPEQQERIRALGYAN
jgi:arylsulfatase A-like enzyme